jgi:uncharacterized protein with GYD domain
MASYLIQISYAPATVAALVKKPTDRTQYISSLVEKIGGKLVGTWMSFGEYDIVLIVEGPSEIGAAACAMAVTGSGAFTKYKTTPLLSMSDAMAAFKQAGTLGYTPPSAS